MNMSLDKNNWSLAYASMHKVNLVIQILAAPWVQCSSHCKSAKQVNKNVLQKTLNDQKHTKKSDKAKEIWTLCDSNDWTQTFLFLNFNVLMLSLWSSKL